MTVDIKTPLVVSTSGWQPNVTWHDSSIPIAAALCRASLGTWLKDTVFANYWNQWLVDGTPRCAYHFLKNSYGSARQAAFFVQCVNDAGGIRPGDKLCLDVEDETGLSITAVIDFLYNVQVLTGVATKDLLIYSRANLMNPLSFSKLFAAQKTYLLEIPTWSAGYADDPNSLNFYQLADIYQYDPLRYGKCVIVQYAASLVIEGIANIEAQGTECNVADPDYLTTWQAETAAPPIGDVMNYKVTTTGQGNIRATGGATLGLDIGDFRPGQVGLGTEILGSPTGAYYCLKVLSGADVAGWVYSRWNNAPTYATIEQVVDVPPVEFLFPDKLVAYHGTETREYFPNA